MARWLEPHEVRAMRRLRRDSNKVMHIAWAFQVSASSVSDVVNRWTYQNVPDQASVSHPMDKMSLLDVHDYYERKRGKKGKVRALPGVGVR